MKKSSEQQNKKNGNQTKAQPMPKKQKRDKYIMQKLHLDRWLNKTELKFHEDVPQGQGTTDLTAFKLKQNSKNAASKPSYDDVQGLNNQDFDDFQININEALKYYN